MQENICTAGKYKVVYGATKEQFLLSFLEGIFGQHFLFCALRREFCFDRLETFTERKTHTRKVPDVFNLCE